MNTEAETLGATKTRPPVEAAAKRIARPGDGPALRRHHARRWRAALRSGVAVGALCMAAVPALAGPDACMIVANVATCSGDQSGGIDAGADFPSDSTLSLIIGNLTGDIVPSNGADGVRWADPFNPNPIVITSDTGDFSIVTRQSGFNVFSNAGKDVVLTHAGNIVAIQAGIFARTQQTDGDSGLVRVTASGDFRTDSDGIHAFSRVVSGDGNAGNVVVDFNGTIVSGQVGIRARSVVEDGQGNSGVVSVGSTGSVTSIEAESVVNGSGDAGAVFVAQNGAITGDGISASSTVNGNGNAGAVQITNTGDVNGVLLAASQVLSGTGNASTVSVTNAGNVANAGTSATTITAVSYAGTNGNAGSVTVNNTGNLIGGYLSVNAVSRASGAGNAGNVAVTTTGDLIASHGVVAQSLADANGVAGSVSVTSRGNITAAQTAILAESDGGQGNGNINISVDNGTVAGGVDGVVFYGGAANTLMIEAGGAVIGGTGRAIAGGNADEMITNRGQVVGDVDLGAGNNNFINQGTALFHTGSIINLGANGMLENAGVLAVGGFDRSPLTALLTGDLEQGASGVFAVDIEGAAADRLDVTGTAAMAGRVEARFNGANGGSQRYTILSAAGGVTDNGITGPADTAVLDYELLFPNANDMVLAVTANFVTGGLTRNQQATAQHLQGALGASGGDLGSVYGYLGGIGGVSDYAQALDRLHPEPYLAQTQSVLLSGLGFADNALSCADGGSNARADAGDEGCGWARIGTSRTSRGRTFENIGFTSDAWSASGGAQFALAPNWTGALAFGYERTNIAVDDRARAQGNLFQFAAGALYSYNGWELSGVLSAGHGSFDTTRLGVLPGVDATGKNTASYVSGRVRAAHAFGGEAGYVKPMIDFDLTALRRGGIVEEGAGSAGLRVHEQTDAIFSVAPAVEVGGQFQLGPDMVVKPFVRAGVRIFGTPELGATASFIGSPSGAAPFTATMPLDQAVGELSTGVDLVLANGLKMGVSYEGRLGGSTQRHTGAFNLRANF